MLCLGVVFKFIFVDKMLNKLRIFEPNNLEMRSYLWNNRVEFPYFWGI